MARSESDALAPMGEDRIDGELWAFYTELQRAIATAFQVPETLVPGVVFVDESTEMTPQMWDDLVAGLTLQDAAVGQEGLAVEAEPSALTDQSADPQTPA